MVSLSQSERKAEYQTYLLSEHWNQFRLKVLADRKECEECGINYRKAVRLYKQGLNVHHLTYERIGKEKKADVKVLCYGCHMKQHGLGDWIKFLQSFSMPDVGEGSRQACDVCGVLNGPIYFNVGEDLPAWVCRECRQ
jgi:cytochrome c